MKRDWFGFLDLLAVIATATVFLLPAAKDPVRPFFSDNPVTWHAITAAQSQVDTDMSGFSSWHATTRLVGALEVRWASQWVDAAMEARPEAWRTRLAKAFVELRKAEPDTALKFAENALSLCLHAGGEDATGIGDGNCHQVEETRIAMFVDHIKAGIASGIDPKRDPEGFQKAALGAVRLIQFD